MRDENLTQTLDNSDPKVAKEIKQKTSEVLKKLPFSLLTLKDIAREDVTDGTYEILTHELREEAIKWIKEISKDGFDEIPNITCIGETDKIMKMIISKESSIVVGWITHFFNITDEELK